MYDIEAEENMHTESVIVNYLKQHIETTDHLSGFLWFVTGTNTLHKPGPIKVQFTNKLGEPLPAALTCFRILMLSRSFASFTQFKRNMDLVLNNMVNKQHYTVHSFFS